MNLGADTSGTMAIMDLDGDGYQELISAGYSADKVYVHTFSPNPWSNKQTKCLTINKGINGIDHDNYLYHNTKLYLLYESNWYWVNKWV